MYWRAKRDLFPHAEEPAVQESALTLTLATAAVMGERYATLNEDERRLLESLRKEAQVEITQAVLDLRRPGA